MILSKKNNQESTNLDNEYINMEMKLLNLLNMVSQ